jgi:type IX secretion system PorP/SprF family membrane protein
MLINPAFTGYTEGSYRIAGNYRSQWGEGVSPYATTFLSFELSPMRKMIPEGHKAGLGVLLLNDRSMNDALQTNAIAMSAAYNISLDEDNIHNIGLGFQGVYNERRIDFSKLTFENQFVDDGFDPALPIGEAIGGNKKRYFNINAGGAYHLTLEDKSFFAGLSVYNILRPADDFNTREFRIPVRYTAIAGGEFDVGVNGNLYVSGNYQNQGSASEVTMGIGYGILLGAEQNQMIKAGLWHRFNDAIIPYVGYLINGLQAGFSFDYTISQVKTSSQLRNGFEISIIYTAPDRREQKKYIPWY